MKRELLLLAAAVIAVPFLTSCSSDDEMAALAGPHVGAWAYAGADPDAGSLIYARVDALAANESGFEILASGLLVVNHPEYLGGDFPSMIESAGTWLEEEDGDLVLSYVYGDWTRMLQLEILHVDAHAMECVETRLNW